LNFRVPRPLRFSFLQRARRLIPSSRATIVSSEFKNSQTQVPKCLAEQLIMTLPKILIAIPSDTH
jgi:hypothetical protein